MTSGIITHIQRFSVHDGPGIRTTVFLKGCQMHCPWCHNPETYRLQPEIQAFPERCIGCRACDAACQHGAHEFTDTAHIYHRERCVVCGECVETCYAKSLVRVGETRTAESVVAEVLADRPFYQPVGGVTISGGEPLVQADFTRAILDRCRAEDIHTAIETNLAFPWQVVEPLVNLVDLFLVDIKTMDDADHRAATGVSNAYTLDNLKRLDALGRTLVIRTPVVVGFNDRPDQIGAIANFLAKLSNMKQYELLPYHPLGTGKYESLNLDGKPSEFHAPTAAELDALATHADRPNFTVTVAGTTSTSSHPTESTADNHDSDTFPNPASSTSTQPPSS